MENSQTKAPVPATWPVVLVLGAVIFGVVKCAESSAAAERAPEVVRCADRGVRYFKEIGSYPYLTDGRDAMTVSRERCARTLTAF